MIHTIKEKYSLNMRNAHRSLDRALRILMAFTPDNRQIGSIELSEKLEIHPSTVSRILYVLAEHGFVQRDTATRKYSLGESAADLGKAVIGEKAIFRSIERHFTLMAQPIVDDLCNCIGETTALEVMWGESTILVYKTQSERAIQVSVKLGERLPIHVASGAKAILAFSEPSFVDRFLPSKLKSFTPNTIQDPNVLKSQFEEIRRRGVAFDYGELDIDVYTIAAPIFNYKKKPVAAIVLAFPSHRKETYHNEQTILRLKDAANKISSLLFYPEPESEKS